MRGKRLIPRRPGRVRARRRRAPEVAKQELLDAAERVFVDSQPDQVGLKDIAREAGTSHALITHYFGTYAGLIEATLERRLRTLREQTREQLADPTVLAHPESLIAILFRALEDPVHLRLVRWLLASERPSAAHAFGLSANGIQLVAAQIASALASSRASISAAPSNPSRAVAANAAGSSIAHAPASTTTPKDHAPSVPRAVVEKVELAIMTAVAAAYGYAIGKYALVGSAGKQPSRELDEQVQATLSQMVQAHIRMQLADVPLI